jgi:long-chain acyl-CoA synthetase
MNEPAEGRWGPSAQARLQPNKPAFIAADRVVTYREFDARSRALAAALRARGIGAGDRIAILLDNSIEFFEAWAAAAMLEASVVLVNWHLKADELLYILEDSSARLLIADERFAASWHPLVERGGCETLVVPDAYEAAIASGDGATAQLPDCIALAPPVFYTSGTTGRPKGVIHGAFRAEQAVAAQQGQVALWGWSSDDIYILSGPAYHAGPGGYVMAALFVGATTVIPAPRERWDAREWLRLVELHRVTISFMTPAHFIRLLEVAEEDRRADLSSLRVIVHGAAPCPVAVKRRMLEWLPCAVWELYGASEGGATRINAPEWLERPGSVGRAWPGVEIRVLDEHGTQCAVGETGLVYVRPAGGARFHYHDDPEKTDAAWSDDAFTVGDIGHLDDAGYLYLTDRASDMVIRGGVNIYPREVEEVLFGHPGVVDCAVFGVPDDRLGEQLRAVIELRDAVSADDLRAFLHERIADYKMPSEFEFVDELPRNPNGKVMKRQLRELAWEGRDRRIG